ncbi:hypothetical protein [Kutzneria sp. NPDC052558]|uniref:hypothetical protein n=1 Tax=Kutzneria sp. NPDC052558 TaxID=3364121 RepID=UPI0037C72030
MDLRYEYFWSRIEFVVDEVDVGKFWGSVPLLDIASSMKFLADSIVENGKVSVGFTENPTVVSFVHKEGFVEIREPHVKASLSCGLSELMAATGGFVIKVTEWLAEEYPRITKNSFFVSLTS